MTRTLTKTANKVLLSFLLLSIQSHLLPPPPHSSAPLSEQNAPVSSDRSVTLFLFLFLPLE